MFSPLRSRAALASAACALALLSAAAGAQEIPLTAQSRQDLVLTIYNQNLGLVSELRRIDLPAGESLLAIEDVSGQLQPETVLLSARGLRVIEQSLEANLLSPQRMLESALGQMVQLVRTHPETGADIIEEARLLSLNGGMVLQVGDRVEINPPGRIAFAGLPAGLRSEPALLVRVFPTQAGPNDLQLDYLTGGLSWQADYVARLNGAGDRLDLSALVTVTNTTDSDFEGAKLRLVAGEVNQGPRGFKGPQPVMRAEADMAMMSAAPGVSEAVSAADRYVYSVARPVTVKRGETKQIPLMSAQNVKVNREYRFEALVNGRAGIEEIGPVNADLSLEVVNDPDLGLGAPLPAGTLRVYGPSGGGPSGNGGGNLFLGADSIGHTPVGEKARLSLGEAFDVTARAYRSVYDRLSDRSYESGQRVVVKNAKDEAVQVVLVGHMPNGWTMREESAPHEKETANRIVWRLSVPGGGEAELTYRLRVSN